LGGVESSREGGQSVGDLTCGLFVTEETRVVETVVRPR
jgi:hypothetical protein